MSAVVYVLVAGWDYEGSNPVSVFEDRYAGEAAATMCWEHKSSKPAWPETDADDDAIAKWSQADTAWRNASPAGHDNADADYYSIIEVPLIAKEPD